MNTGYRNPRNNPNTRGSNSIDHASIRNVEVAHELAIAESPPREEALRLKKKLGNEAIASDPELVSLIKCGVETLESDAHRAGEEKLRRIGDFNELLNSESDDEPWYWHGK